MLAYTVTWYHHLYTRASANELKNKKRHFRKEAQWQCSGRVTYWQNALTVTRKSHTNIGQDLRLSRLPPEGTYGRPSKGLSFSLAGAVRSSWHLNAIGDRLQLCLIIKSGRNSSVSYKLSILLCNFGIVSQEIWNYGVKGSGINL